MNNKLRVAIMLNEPLLTKWEHAVVSYLFNSGVVEPVAWICRNSKHDVSRKEGFFFRIINFQYKLFLWKLYNKIRGVPNVFKTESHFRLLDYCPIIMIDTIDCGKFRENFSQRDLERISSLRPDFILRFGFNILQGEILSVAPYGVWSFHHDDPEIIRGGPPAFWEFMRGDLTTGLVLQKLNEKLDAGIILRRGKLKTVAHSYRGNLNQLMMAGVEWPAQVAAEILSDKASFESNYSPPKKRGKLFSYPNNGQMIRFFFKTFLQRLIYHLNDILWAEKWNVAVVENTSFDSINTGKAKWMYEKKAGCFLADPFPSYQHRDKFYVEYFDYRKGQGEIHLVDESGQEIEKIYYDKGHHSFPFTMVVNDEEYLLPEQSVNHKVTLMNRNSFAESDLLVNFAAVDANVFYHNEKWWLFCTSEDSGPNSHLYIFFSDDLDREFKSHPQNPVKIDCAGSRPAGKIYFHEGKLFRPGQNCSRTYGGSIIWFELVELNEFKFEEKPVAEIFPDAKGKYPDGIHTINEYKDGWVVDGKRKEFSWAHAWYKIKNRVI